MDCTGEGGKKGTKKKIWRSQANAQKRKKSKNSQALYKEKRARTVHNMQRKNVLRVLKRISFPGKISYTGRRTRPIGTKDEGEGRGNRIKSDKPGGPLKHYVGFPLIHATVGDQKGGIEKPFSKILVLRWPHREREGRKKGGEIIDAR